MKKCNVFYSIVNTYEHVLVLGLNYYFSLIKQESGVKVSDVTYKGIRGTSATKVAVKFDCSAANPCTSLRLEDVKLTYTNEDQVAQASCSNANGKAHGLVQPNSCL